MTEPQCLPRTIVLTLVPLLSAVYIKYHCSEMCACLTLSYGLYFEHRVRFGRKSSEFLFMQTRCFF